MGTAEGPKQDGEATAISSRDSNQPQRSYLSLKGFRFKIGCRSEADIQIFLESCKKHKDDLKNIPDGKLRWANIAKSGAEASTDPVNFTISHCLELGESIYNYTENNEQSLKDDATFIYLCDQIKDFKEYLLTPVIKNNTKQLQPGKMEKEILPENKVDEIIAVARQHVNLFNIKGCDKAHVWKEISKKVNIKNADKYLYDNLKSKIIEELKNEEDPELKKEKFLERAQPIIDIFDFIQPRAIKVVIYVPDFKHENEEMRKTNDPEPVVAEGPPEMVLPKNVSAKNHEENYKKIKNVKRKSHDETPEIEKIEEKEESFEVNYEPPVKKKKKSREVFIAGWSNDDVYIFVDACVDNKDQLKEGKGWTKWTSVAESCRHMSKNPDCFNNANCEALGFAFKKKFESIKHLLDQEGREHWKALFDKAQVVWSYLNTDLIIDEEPKSEEKESVKKPKTDEKKSLKKPKTDENVKRKRGRPAKIAKIPDVEPDTTSQNDEKETESHQKQRKREPFPKLKNDETPMKTVVRTLEEPSSSMKPLKTRGRQKKEKKIKQTPKKKAKDHVHSTTQILITDVRSVRPDKNIETPETSETCETDTETIDPKPIKTPGSNTKGKVRFAPCLEEQKEARPEIRPGFPENIPEMNPGLNQFPHMPGTSGMMRPENLMHQNPQYPGMFVYPPRPTFPFDMNNQIVGNQYYTNMYPFQPNMSQPGPSGLMHPAKQRFANPGPSDHMALVPSHGEVEIPHWFKQYVYCRDMDNYKFYQLFNQKNEFLQLEREKRQTLEKILDKLDLLEKDRD